MCRSQLLCCRPYQRMQDNSQLLLLLHLPCFLYALACHAAAGTSA
jgi:hypothetical protein